MTKVEFKDYYFVDGKPVAKILTSKVYGEYYKRMPSGMRKMVKVWNTRTNSMMSIKAEQIVAII